MVKNQQFHMVQPNTKKLVFPLDFLISEKFKRFQMHRISTNITLKVEICWDQQRPLDFYAYFLFQYQVIDNEFTEYIKHFCFGSTMVENLLRI